MAIILNCIWRKNDFRPVPDLGNLWGFQKSLICLFLCRSFMYHFFFFLPPPLSFTFFSVYKMSYNSIHMHPVCSLPGALKELEPIDTQLQCLPVEGDGLWDRPFTTPTWPGLILLILADRNIILYWFLATISLWVPRAVFGEEVSVEGHEFFPWSGCCVMTVLVQALIPPNDKQCNSGHVCSGTMGTTSCSVCVCMAATLSVALISGMMLVHFCMLEPPAHQRGSLPGFGKHFVWTTLLPFINLNSLLKMLCFYLVYSFDYKVLKKKKNHLLLSFTSDVIFLEEVNEYHQIIFRNILWHSSPSHWQRRCKMWRLAPCVSKYFIFPGYHTA